MSDDLANELYEEALRLNMSVIVEVHTVEEAEKALNFKEALIGINNRNLKTFDVSLQTTLNLFKEIPNDKITVTESGIFTSKDINLMKQHGIYSFLVGEAFMRDDDPGKSLKQLLVN